MIEPTVTVTPSVLPATLDELKAEIRMESDITAEDDLLTGYLETAVEACQTYARRYFITQTVEWKTRPDCVNVRLPMSPIQSITSVLDEDEEAVEYELDDTRLRPVIELETLPEKVTVTAVVGYGDEASDVPRVARTAIVKTAARYWRDRDEAAPIPEKAKDLLDFIAIREFN